MMESQNLALLIEAIHFSYFNKIVALHGFHNIVEVHHIMEVHHFMEIHHIMEFHHMMEFHHFI